MFALASRDGFIGTLRCNCVQKEQTNPIGPRPVKKVMMARRYCNKRKRDTVSNGERYGNVWWEILELLIIWPKIYTFLRMGPNVCIRGPIFVAESFVYGQKTCIGQNWPRRWRVKMGYNGTRKGQNNGRKCFGTSEGPLRPLWSCTSAGRLRQCPKSDAFAWHLYFFDILVWFRTDSSYSSELWENNRIIWLDIFCLSNFG